MYLDRVRRRYRATTACLPIQLRRDLRSLRQRLALIIAPLGGAIGGCVRRRDVNVTMPHKAPMASSIPQLAREISLTPRNRLLAIRWEPGVGASRRHAWRARER